MYGIEPCRCDRCAIEEAVLDPAEVRKVVEDLSRARFDPDASKETVAASAEEAAEQAEIVVARALERFLQDAPTAQAAAARIPRLSFPESPISAARMAMLREGFEKFSDTAEQESFARQERLHFILLGSLANIVRAYAASLKGLNRYINSALAWSKVHEVLEQVIPCSELSAIASSEMLSAKLLASHLDYQKTGRAAMRTCLLTTHKVYGGGIEVWRKINMHLFAATVLEGAGEVWAPMVRELGLAADGYDPASLRTVPAPAASSVGARSKPSVGFEDLLRQRAQGEHRGERGAREGGEGGELGGTGADKAAGPKEDSSDVLKKRTGNDLRDGPGVREAGDRPSNAAAAVGHTAGAAGHRAGAGPEGVPPTEAAAHYEVSATDQEVKVVAYLPGLASAAEVSLEVCEKELRIKSLRPDLPHALDVPLPVAVQAESTGAKWSKRTQQLTVRLRIQE